MICTLVLGKFIIQLKSRFKLGIACLVTFTIFLSNLVYAQEHQPLKITGAQIEALIDPEHQLTVHEILAQKDLDWQKINSASPSYGFSPHTYWFRFTLPAQNHDSVLELDYALLDEITYYRVDDGKILETIFTGDKRNFSERPIQHRLFLFPTPKIEHDQTILLKIRSSSAVQLSLALWPSNSFFEKDQNVLMENGLYYGIALVMLLYNLFLFFRLRNKLYLFYVFYVTTFISNQLSLSGFAYQFLWPNLPAWHEKSIAIGVPLGLFSSLIFVNSFLKIKRFFPKIYIFTSIQAFIAGTVAALAVVYSYSTMIPYVAILSIISSLTVLVVTYYVMLNRMYKYEIYFAAAWTAFLLGISILALNKLGIIPRTGFTESAAQIGSAIEIVLLSFALAERLYDATQRRFTAERESLRMKEKLISTQKKQNQELESRVNSRTQDLQAALEKVNTLNKELSDLSTMDQVTGVRNRRYFDDILSKEFGGALGGQSHLSLIMIDLDYFKRINDTYGHLAGDLCLKMVASTVHNVVQRTSDLVCRYGGEELAIVLPDTDQQGAMNIAERIRNEIERLDIIFANQVIGITASLGVASFIPDSDKTAELLIDLADKALYQAKNEGRNCTRSINLIV